jgi:hypothetical protein
VEAILARSEQVMGICQGILNGEMITPTYQPLSPEAGPGQPLSPEGPGLPALCTEPEAAAVVPEAAGLDSEVSN